jgi:hypothetical protein
MENITLDRVSALVGIMTQQQGTVARLKAELESAEAALRRTETEDLPELMNEVGLTELTTKEGVQVSIAQDVLVGIPEARMPQAVAWLAERGYDGIVKTEVSVKFGRGEREQADSFAEAVSAKGLAAEVANKINTQTLKAFVRERMAAGEVVPFDIFGIHPFNRAKLKAKKR